MNTNVLEMAAQAKARIGRLSEIAKEQSRIRKDRDKLDAQEQKLINEANALVGNGAMKRPGRPRKASKKKDASKRSRATSKTGESLAQIMLRVAPDSKSDGLSKADLAVLVAKEGYKTTSADPAIIMGQCLGRNEWFEAASRGLWRRSAAGDKALVEASKPE